MDRVPAQVHLVDEVKRVGEERAQAQQRCSMRDRNTVNRAYNVVGEFERRGIITTQL